MKNYILEKYKGWSSRYTCPKCGRSHCFTRYIDTWTGQYLADDVGMCDHKKNCGYHKPPREYFKEHGNGYLSERKQFASPEFVKPIEGKFDVIPMSAIAKLERLNHERNTLKKFLLEHFPLSDLQQVFSDYHIGTAKNGETIFPQIDIQGRCRTAKIMAYDENGHRIKGETDKINWLHARLKQKKRLSHNWNLKQCLFGEHLLSSRPNDAVCLVESEKTAIICALTYPEECLWLACGGKQNLKPEMCQALEGRNVLLFPDADAVADWEERSKLLSFCRKTKMVRWYKHEAEDSKRDIADAILEQHPKEAQDKVQETPQEKIKLTTIGDICQWTSEAGIEKDRVQINV